MSDFDVLYNNMHRTRPIQKKKSENKKGSEDKTQESEKNENSKNSFLTLFSKIF